MVAQTTNISSDGTSPNRLYDCVPASIGSAILWYEGKPQWDSTINPDKLLDMSYPEGYQGGTAALNFVEPCAKLGYYLYPINGTPTQLVQAAHLHLANQHPVIFTRDDPYSNNPGDSHVSVWYADGSTNGQEYLIAMDPFPLPGTASGHPVHNFDSAWEPLLRFNQIWILEKLPPQEETVSIDLSTPGVSTYFQSVPGNAEQWKCIQTGKIIQFGILSAYQQWGNSALCGLSFLGLPNSSEIPIAGVTGAVKQFFERGVLVYDPSHKVDNPPGTGSVYAAHLYSGVGVDPMIAVLEAKIVALQQAQPSATLTTDMQQIKAIAGKY